MRRSITRLEHIRDAIERIKAYTAEQSEQDFLSNSMLQDAVSHQVSIIGEAIVHVDDDILQHYDYPWYAVRAFRNYNCARIFRHKPIQSLGYH